MKYLASILACPRPRISALGGGAGARFDFWRVLDGSNNVDGSGISGGEGASAQGQPWDPGGNDGFKGTRRIFEDGVDQYSGCDAGLRQHT